MNHNTGTYCGGTLVAGNKVLTASHCIFESAANVEFHLHHCLRDNGTSCNDDAIATATRVVLGSEAGFANGEADWAMVTLNVDLSGAPDFQKMYMVVPTGSFFVSDYGYPSDWPNKATYQTGGTLTIGANNGALFTDLDMIEGQSGGPLYRVTSPNTAAIYGTASAQGRDDCTGYNGNYWSNAVYFAFAPDNVVGIASANSLDGRLTLFYSDKDWSFLGYRTAKTTAAGSGFYPWAGFAGNFASGGRMAAVNLQDNTQEVWAIDSGSHVQTKYQSSNGSWSGWVSQPNYAGTAKDIVATGGSGIKTHLFVLGTDNTVKVLWKTGAANSPWSSPVTIATIPAAMSMSALYIPTDGTHEVFVADGSSLWTTYGSQGSFSAKEVFKNGTGVTAVGTGLLGDGRVKVVIQQSAGFYGRVRDSDGVWRQSWFTMAAPIPYTYGHSDGTARGTDITGFVAFNFGMQAGKARIFGLASNREIFTLLEGSPNVFPSAWSRFVQ